MLNDAYRELPPKVFKRERFEVPRPVCTVFGSRTIFHNFKPDTFERLIERYLNQFVVCPVCKRPDTKIVKEKRLHFLVCEACGARSSVKPI